MKDKYLVIKIEDGLKYLNKEDKAKLCELEMKIRIGRADNKANPNNKYAVINLDEPYAKEITNIMKEHGHWED